MIQTAVCNDKYHFVAQIHTMLTSQAKGLPYAIHISTYLNSNQLFCDVEEGRRFDLLFLDIEIPEDNGMNLTSAIGKLLPLALIVFVTSHTKYAVKAYELSVFRYIPRSELGTCLPLALSDACGLLTRNPHDTYVIESSRMMRKIAADDILYIYRDQKYTIIVLGHEEILHHKSLNQVLGELCTPKRGGGFLMMERGYIVNLFHVEKMKGSELFPDNGAVTPVSRRDQKGVRNTITSYWREKLWVRQPSTKYTLGWDCTLIS